MEMNSVEMAARMKGCKVEQLNTRFNAYLGVIEDYADVEGATLHSRQAVAMAIATWEVMTGNNARAV